MEPAKKRRATYQDVIEAPEHMIAEIIDGELWLSNRPAGPATTAASVIGHILGPPLMHGDNGPGGWLILWEPELLIGDDIVVPDLAGWRCERMSLVPDAPSITVPPDWVCEVLSRSTERTDRERKMPIYASAGISYAWLVHPRRRTLEAFRLQHGQWISIATLADAERARIEPFDVIEIDLARLWAFAALPTRVSEPHAEYVAGPY